jgi:hypothetical protein
MIICLNFYALIISIFRNSKIHISKTYTAKFPLKSSKIPQKIPKTLQKIPKFEGLTQNSRGQQEII